MAGANQQTPVTATARTEFTLVDTWPEVHVAEAQEDWHLQSNGETGLISTDSSPLTHFLMAFVAPLSDPLGATDPVDS